MPALHALPLLLVRLALVAGLVACDPGALLGGALHFEEIDAAEAARRRAVTNVRVLQVREPDSGEPRVEGAEVFALDAALPDRGEAPRGGVLVVGGDDDAVRRFAARLVRAGFERVAAVRGGLAPWTERRSAARAATR